MKKKTKVLLSSIATIAMTASLAVGGTYALFTSEDSVNVAVTSGKVEVTATIDSVTLYSMGVPQTGKFANGGTATIEDDEITLTNVTPGDKAVVSVDFANKSNVTIQYRMGVTMTGELAEYLKLSDENGAPLTMGYTLWETVTTPTTDNLTFAVELPAEETEGQGASATISVFVEAVQGNAEVTNIYSTPAAAQAALDNAVAGDTIQLQAGVDYGTLYIRPVAGQANTITDCDYLVYHNEMLRKVENLTIIGAPGATVDAIKVVSGYIEGSTGYVVDIKNLVVDSVEFSDTYTNAPHSYASPLFFDTSYINVDGLTVKNCKLIGNNDKMNLVYFYSSGNPSNSTFITAAKNVTITGNTVDGISRLCELRQTENVTITNNTIKNTTLHGMLLTVDKGVYSGNVTVTGNTAYGINDRFVRMAGAGDANIVIKDNTITNYLGEDMDYIKVTDSTGTPVIENNKLISVWDGVVPTAQPKSLVVDTTNYMISIYSAEAFAYLNTLANDSEFYTKYGSVWKYTIELNADINLNNNAWTPIVLKNFISFEGNGHTVSNLNVSTNENNAGLFSVYTCNDIGVAYIRDLTIDGAYVKGSQNVGVLVGSGNCTAENVTVINATVDGVKYVGVLAGRLSGATNCTVKSSTVQATDKTVGGLVGYAIGDPSNTTFTGNTVDTVTVTGAYNVGGLLGQAQNVTVNGNTVKNATVISTTALPANASSNEVRTAKLAARSAFATTVIGTNTVENVTLQDK